MLRTLGLGGYGNVQPDVLLAAGECFISVGSVPTGRVLASGYYRGLGLSCQTIRALLSVLLDRSQQ